VLRVFEVLRLQGRTYLDKGIQYNSLPGRS